MGATRKEIDKLEERVARLERELQIMKLQNAPLDPTTKALLAVLNKLPKMAPYALEEPE